MKILKTFVKLMGAGSLLVLLSSVVAAADPVRSDMFSLSINGDEVEFGENVPVIVEDRTLLPLRFVFEQLDGDELEWNEEERLATLTRGEDVVKLWVDTGKAEVNGTEANLEVAPIIYNDSTYVPLAFIADDFDMSVHWDNDNFAAYIADNSQIDKIIDLIIGNSQDGSIGMPSTSADIMIEMEIRMEAGGLFDDSMKIHSEGKVQQDHTNRFQHTALSITVHGENEKLFVESYDDGNAMYMLVNDDVIKTQSAFTYTESLLSQYSGIYWLDIAQKFYSGLKLEEDDEKFTVSGKMFIPEEDFHQLIMAGFNESFAEAAEDVAQMIGGMEVKFIEPVDFIMVFHRETRRPLSMQMRYAVEMSMDVFGEKFFIFQKYSVNMPKFEYDVKFDTTVPARIVEGRQPQGT